jgi:hypothetical protein
VISAAEPAGAQAVATRTSDYHRAIALAFILCGLFTAIGLLVPPSMSHDAGWGVQELRTRAGGGPINSIISPDAADISRDRVSRITWWSPGQYMVPGVFTLLGLRLGVALSLTAGVSLLCCLLGWIQFAKYFALGPTITILLVLLVATFRYSTLPFGIYNGGEILLQGITPWLFLAGCRVPSASFLRAAGLVFIAIWISFFAKLTGLIVVGAILTAAGVEALARLRQVTAGMVGGAVGAIVAFGSLYVAWFSHGTTPASGTGWSFHFGYLLFALGAPWGAGISWTDMLTSLLFNARHPLLKGALGNGDLSVFLWFLLPPVVLFLAVIVKGWRKYAADTNLRRLLIITAGFYAVSVVVMSAIFAHGGDVSLEERHLRASGMLIFACVLAVASHLPGNSVSRLAVGALCGVMSLYGCFAFAYRAWSMKRAEIDRYSRTHLPSVDERGIEFLRTEFAKDGRDALFLVPSPDVVSAFPPSARILSNHVEFDTETEISAKTYRGKVPGSLYVIMPTRIAQSPKGPLVLREFTDYSFGAWEARNFGNSTVFVH